MIVEASQTSDRAAIVYASPHHGNTAKIARAMAEVLNADLFNVDEVQPDTLDEYKLVGFGSGIYFARHHRSLRKLVDSLTCLPREAFVFSTAGLPFFARLYHSSLRRKLVQHGCRILGEFTCRGWDTAGPLILIGGINWFHPNSRDLRRAIDFAAHLRDERRAA